MADGTKPDGVKPLTNNNGVSSGIKMFPIVMVVDWREGGINEDREHHMRCTVLLDPGHPSNGGLKINKEQCLYFTKIEIGFLVNKDGESDDDKYKYRELSGPSRRALVKNTDFSHDCWEEAHECLKDFCASFKDMLEEKAKKVIDKENNSQLELRPEDAEIEEECLYCGKKNIFTLDLGDSIHHWDSKSTEYSECTDYLASLAGHMGGV